MVSGMTDLPALELVEDEDWSAADHREYDRRNYIAENGNRLRGVSWLGQRKPLDHLITGVVPRSGLGQVWGPSFAGKTAVVLDLALSICSGQPEWFGLPINVTGPQRVVYVAAEGGQPFWDGVEAWLSVHPDANLSGLQVLDGAEGDILQVAVEPREVQEIPLAKSITGLEFEIEDAYDDRPPVLIVLDPQINIMPTVDEQSNKEMARVLVKVKQWADMNEYLVLLVHHTGHDRTRARGASAQKGLLDLVVGLDTVPGTGRGQIVFEKIKGGAPREPLGYSIQSVPITGGSGKGAYAYRDDTQTKQGRVEVKESVRRAEQQTVLTKVKEGLSSANKIALALGKGWSRGKVQDLLTELEADGLVENVNETDNPRANEWKVTLAGQF